LFLEFTLDEDWIIRVQGEMAEKMQEILLKESVDQVRKLITVADLLHASKISQVLSSKMPNFYFWIKFEGCYFCHDTWGLDELQIKIIILNTQFADIFFSPFSSPEIVLNSC
jgi:hypothetical protein